MAEKERGFFNTKDAAIFCGYSESQFREFCKKYQIPRYGPQKTRFKREDLLLWMEIPEVFLASDGGWVGKPRGGRYRLISKEMIANALMTAVHEWFGDNENRLKLIDLIEKRKREAVVKLKEK